MGEWAEGLMLARDLASAPLARVSLLRFFGRYWSPDKLRGFLDGHAALTQLARCTCGDCPIHFDQPSAPAAGSN